MKTRTTISMLGLLTMALVAAPVTQAGPSFYWWVGTCNGTLINREVQDVNVYAPAVQGDDPVGATAFFAGESAVNGVYYADCLVAGTDRVQAVFPGQETHTVIVEDCQVTCAPLWDGQGRLTLTCLDNGDTVVWEGGNRPQLDHRCVVQSTLERNGADLSVLAWKTILA